MNKAELMKKNKSELAAMVQHLVDKVDGQREHITNLELDTMPAPAPAEAENTLAENWYLEARRMGEVQGAKPPTCHCPNCRSPIRDVFNQICATCGAAVILAVENRR